MSTANDLDRKFFHALLNGLTQGFIYGKADITLAYLQEQLFGSSSMKPAGAALTRTRPRCQYSSAAPHVHAPCVLLWTRFVAGQVLLMEELLRLLRLASSQYLTLEALEAELQQVQ